VDALSGGFKRRLAIAISLMNAPELLILDEPTTGLDPAARQALWERLRVLRATGTTILLTTHYMDEAERLCDRLVILAEGRIMVDGSPRDLIRQILPREVLELDVCAESEQAVVGELNGLERLRNGNRLNLYVEDAGALLETMRHRNGSACAAHTAATIRSTNLEDVFLKLTGTNLEAHENGDSQSPL
jgi:lipooligosaccharide transport system ATP-binding protein